MGKKLSSKITIRKQSLCNPTSYSALQDILQICVNINVISIMATADGGAIQSYINPTTLTAVLISSHLQSNVLSTLLPSCLATKTVNAFLYYPIHAKCHFTLCQTSSSQQHLSHTRRKNICMYICIHTQLQLQWRCRI